jgi:hypothetical protein
MTNTEHLRRLLDLIDAARDDDTNPQPPREPSPWAMPVTD